MKVQEKLKNCLNKNNIDYVMYYHNSNEKTGELASNLGFLEREFVRTFIVKTEDGYAMMVIPAGQVVDLDLFKCASSKARAKLVKLEEVKTLFPDCEAGAVPPLGNLYEYPVYVSDTLRKRNDIVFHAGTHTDTIKMRYEDFDRLVKPKIYKISKPAILSN